MDTLTHGLAGALLARSLPSTGSEPFDRALARREAWVGFGVAMFPDADVFVSPFSAEFYITQHRALTHSFVTLPVWIVALTFVAALRLPAAIGLPGSATRRVAWRRLGAVVALGLVSHILLDWITSWGTMFLSPLSWTRYMLDWTFIVDLSLSGLLALALLGVRFVSRRSLGRSRTAARAGLLAATAYVGLCAVRHGEALRLAADLGKGADRSAIPQPGSPDRWLLISDEGTAVKAAFVDLGKRGPEGARAADAEELARTGFRRGLLSLVRHLDSVYRSRDDLGTRVIEKANGPYAQRTLDSGIAGVFGRFARYPVAREDAKDANGAVRVLLRDVRFGYLSSEVDPFTWVVRYAPDGSVLSAGFPSSRWTQAADAKTARAKPIRAAPQGAPGGAR